MFWPTAGGFREAFRDFTLIQRHASTSFLKVSTKLRMPHERQRPHSELESEVCAYHLDPSTNKHDE